MFYVVSWTAVQLKEFNNLCCFFFILGYFYKVNINPPSKALQLSGWLLVFTRHGGRSASFWGTKHKFLYFPGKENKQQQCAREPAAKQSTKPQEGRSQSGMCACSYRGSRYSAGAVRGACVRCLASKLPTVPFNGLLVLARHSARFSLFSTPVFRQALTCAMIHKFRKLLPINTTSCLIT